MSNTEIQRIPVFLWNHLQEVIVKQDQLFMNHISKILKIPISDLKKRLFGSRGVATTLTVEQSPWWVGLQCPIMEKHPGNMWKRCGKYRDASGYCWNHRNVKCGNVYKHYEDEYFKQLPVRMPVHYEGNIVWVSEKGDMLHERGIVLEGLQMDINRLTINDTRQYGIVESTRKLSSPET